jgi:G3E family GTPase
VKERAPSLRLTILGGSPGAGKTTWLRRQLRGGAFRDAFVITHGAPDGLAFGSDGDAGLIDILRSFCAEPAALGYERIVLEASGQADPAALAEAIRGDRGLSSRLVVSETIVAVDALANLEELRTQPLSRLQIDSADCLIVTKVDACEPAALMRFVSTLKSLRPNAPIFGAANGEETALPWQSSSAPAPSELIATTLTLDNSIDWTGLSLWLSALLHARGSDIVEVKGVLRTPAGRLRIESSGGAVGRPEIVPDRSDCEADGDNQLVIVGRGYGAEDLQRSLRFFTQAAQDRS